MKKKTISVPVPVLATVYFEIEKPDGWDDMMPVEKADFVLTNGKSDIEKFFTKGEPIDEAWAALTHFFEKRKRRC